MRLRKNFFLFFIIIISTFFLSNYFLNYINTKKIVSDDTYYFLKQNKSQRSIVRELAEKNIKISYFEWRILSFFRNSSVLPKAGEYLIPKNSTILDIQNIFHEGDTITRSFTLIEGTTADDLKMKLLDNKYLSGKIDILKEGVYKPDTYNFKYGFPRAKLLERMEKAQNELIEEIWKEKPNNYVLKNKKELLILASIIEKEAKFIKDKKLVASVFINRLKNKMKLQSDVTLAYGYKVNGNKITKKMLKSSHPYNTYYNYGLPPTPISYPGVDALNSLRYIKKTDYLYFVTDGNGSHRFSKTYSIHKKNIKLWKDSTLKDK